MQKKRRTILGLNGLPQSGKDTLARHLIERHGFVRLAFADRMREALYRLNPEVRVPSEVYQKHYAALGGRGVRYLNDEVLFRLQTLVDGIGWDIAKVQVPDVRELLRRFGTEVGRDIFGKDIWVHLLHQDLQALPADAKVVITDVRFPNEATFLAEQNGFLVNISSPTREQPPSGHASDAGLPARLFDAFVVNEGTLADLFEHGDGLVKHFAERSAVV